MQPAINKKNSEKPLKTSLRTRFEIVPEFPFTFWNQKLRCVVQYKEIY